MTIDEIHLEKNTLFEKYFCISVFATFAYAASNWKFLYQEINHIKKNWTHEILTRKNFRPTKYSREKFWIHEVPTRRNFRPTNTHEKIRTHENTHEKKFQTNEYPQQKFWTHEIPTRKKFEPTKYPRKNFGPTNYPQRHDGTKSTRPKIARDPLNFAHFEWSHWKPVIGFA